MSARFSGLFLWLVDVLRDNAISCANLRYRTLYFFKEAAKVVELEVERRERFADGVFTTEEAFLDTQ